MSDIISILVASKHDNVRDRIITELAEQNDFNIASIEKDEYGAVIKSERLKPDIVIIDFEPELALIIRRKSPSTSIILLCDKDENDFAAKAIKAGIAGYLLKKNDMNKLIYAIKIVSLGGLFVSESIILNALDTIAFYNQFPGQLRKNSALLSLSPVERIILQDIAKGNNDKEIAQHLNYNKGTIRNILVDIKRRTKLRNRIQIVLYSLVNGIINLDLKDFFKTETDRRLVADTKCDNRGIRRQNPQISSKYK